jgi:hypothetical protein
MTRSFDAHVSPDHAVPYPPVTGEAARRFNAAITHEHSADGPQSCRRCQIFRESEKSRALYESGRENHGLAPRPRPIHQIAAEIAQDWDPPYFGAVPYIRAMASVSKLSDAYGADDGEYLVRYFLGNAGTWRGETARRIKAELKAMLAGAS